jgi:hypothetical protein
MHTVGLILLVFFFVFEAIAAFVSPAEPYRVRLVAAGLACYALGLIFGAMGR